MQEPVDRETADWIERQLTEAIQPTVECVPDTERGLTSLRRLRGQRRLQRHRRTWTAISLAFSSALALALPSTRALAVRCIDTCIGGSQFVLAKLSPSQTRLSVNHRNRVPAPDFELLDSNGGRIRLSSYKGQVVLLNFWATWCNPCRLEIPWFVEFQRRYGVKGFSVIGISLDEDGWASVLPYTAKQGINYAIGLADADVLRLFGGLESVPTTLIIDRQGRVASTHVGLVSRTVYERDIEAVLKE